MSGKNEKKTASKVEDTKVEDTPVPVAPLILTVEGQEPVEILTPEQEPRWDLDVWREVVLEKIGTPYYVLVGALTGKDLTAEYSEREVRSLVEKFLNTPAR